MQLTAAKRCAACQAHRSVQLTAAQLPDIRDVFPDNTDRFAEMSISSPSGLDGAPVLISTRTRACDRGVAAIAGPN